MYYRTLSFRGCVFIRMIVKKYILPYEGEYFRDCVFGNSCIGAKVDLTKKFNKVETGSFLQTNYSYDNGLIIIGYFKLIGNRSLASAPCCINRF